MSAAAATDNDISLYQAVILERSRNPRFRHRLDGTGVLHAKCDNPLCGDEAAVELRLGPDGQILDAGFSAEGCAILLASCDLMAETVRGLSCDQARALGAGFEAMLGGGADVAAPTLMNFAPLRAHPARRRCATLPWQTLATALAGEQA